MAGGQRSAAQVLIADDGPRTAEILASIADGSAYRIVCTRDGREVYRVMVDDAGFAAAIFNMTIPRLRGVDLVRHMKAGKRLMRIPVIVVSGDNGIRPVADSFAAGAIAFLAKPFAAEQLQRGLLLALSGKFPRAGRARRLGPRVQLPLRQPKAFRP